MVSDHLGNRSPAGLGGDPLVYRELHYLYSPLSPSLKLLFSFSLLQQIFLLLLLIIFFYSPSSPPYIILSAIALFLECFVS